MLLWVIFAILTAGVLISVLWPAFRSTTTHSSRNEYDIAVYKDQLNELDQDLERGLISPEEAKSARTEISRRILARSDKEDEGKTDRPLFNPRIPAIASLVFIPVMTLVLYLAVGSPDKPDQPLYKVKQERRQAEQSQIAHVNSLIAKVEERLRKNPDEGRGWEALAPVYFKMERFDDAARAYKESARLLGETAERLTGYAESLVRANNEVITAEAKAAYEKALKLNPGMVLPKIRLIFALEQDGKKQEAIQAWKAILPIVKDNAPLSQMAKMRIAELTGNKNTAQPQNQTAAENTEQKGPTSEDIKAAGQMNASDRAAMIRNMVSGLDERLTENGGSVEEWMKLIRAYNVLGKKDMALAALKKAKDNLKGNNDALSKLDTFAKQMGLVS